MTFYAKFGQMYACRICGGNGIIARKRWVFFGRVIVKRCAVCRGSGIDPRRRKAYERARKDYKQAGGE